MTGCEEFQSVLFHWKCSWHQIDICSHWRLLQRAFFGNDTRSDVLSMFINRPFRMDKRCSHFEQIAAAVAMTSWNFHLVKRKENSSPYYKYFAIARFQQLRQTRVTYSFHDTDLNRMQNSNLKFYHIVWMLSKVFFLLDWLQHKKRKHCYLTHSYREMDSCLFQCQQVREK